MAGRQVRWFVALLFALSVVPEATAQLLHGSVSDAETGAPVAGVLITVRDSSSLVRGRVLTDEAGRYALAAGPGRYRITAEHIGFTSTTSTALVGSASVLVRFDLRPAPIALTEVVAHGSARCRTTNDPAAARVWSVARTALGAAAAETAKWFSVRMFTRYLDLNLRAVEPQRSEYQRHAGRRGFRSISLDSLLQFGFVQERSGSRYFYGPDAELLLADAFVDAYCFRVVRDPGHAGLIGLAYWPQARVRVPGIRGTMWIDEQDGALKYVEYTYTGIGELNPRYAGGRVDFERQPDLTWFVRTWHIRMPRYGQVLTSGKLSLSLIGVEEYGGEVLGMDDVTQPTRTGEVRGAVYDSITRQPLADAEVYLSGTSYRDRTDARGNFLLSDVRAGAHQISFFHPSMRTLPVFRNLAAIEVSADSVTATTLAIPSEATLLATHCERSELDEAATRLAVSTRQLSVITGTVRSSFVLPNTRVHITWDARTLAARAINRRVTGIWADVAANGSYRICGVPTGLDLTLEVVVDGRVAHRELLGTRQRAMRKDIELD